VYNGLTYMKRFWEQFGLHIVGTVIVASIIVTAFITLVSRTFYLTEGSQVTEYSTRIFFDFSHTPALIFYAYFPITVLAIFFAYAVMRYDRENATSRYMIIFLVSFLFWLFLEAVSLIVVHIPLYVFTHQLMTLAVVLISASGLLFAHAFFFRERLPIIFGEVTGVVLVVTSVLLPTTHNVASIFIYGTQRAIENTAHVLPQISYGFLHHAVFFLSLLCVSLIVYFGFKKYKTHHTTDSSKAQTLLLVVGLTIYLLIFLFTQYVGDDLFVLGVNIFGPLAILAFLGTLSYLIIRYQVFHTRVVATQMLVALMVSINISLLFMNNIQQIRSLLGVTIVLLIGFGILLVRAVQERMTYVSEMEQMAAQITLVNKRLVVLDNVKSEFISFATHQLRTPLTGIKWSLSIFVNDSLGKLNQDQHQLAQKTLQQCDNLIILVEDLLSVSKIQQGGMKYDMSQVDLHQLVKSVVLEMRPLAERKNLPIKIDMKNDVTYVVNGDVTKLRQVIVNLIDNAIKYTEKGSIELRFKLVDGGKIQLLIKDTGTGIASGTKLFSKFSRGFDSGQHSGSGIGLYLAHKIISAHGGQVSAESKGEHTGSTFIVELPLT